MRSSDPTELAEAALLTLGRQAQIFSPAGPGVAEELVALTSTVEAYIDGVLRALIRDCDLARHPFIAGMYAHMEDLIFQSWPERFRWLKTGFRVSISGSTPAQNMQTLVALRNSIVHGGGRLTDRQTRELSDLIQLEHRLRQVLDVGVERRSLQFSAATLGRAIQTCREFVLAFDDELRVQHPHAKL